MLSKIAIVLTLWTFLMTTAVQADDLTIHLYPSPHTLDWSSPKKLTRSVVLSEVIPNIYPIKHDIGHATVELRCSDSFSILTGMTNTDSNVETSLLLQKEIGLGILFYRFQGRLQTADETKADLNARYAHGAVDWIHFLISPQTCQRLETYVTQYRASDDEKYYGLNLRPLYGEGAGCSAFAVSFVELAGLLNDEFTQAWSKTMDVPDSLIGDPPQSKVSLLSLLFGSSGESWASDEQAGTSIFFWEPDTMFRWVHSQLKKYATETIESSSGIVIDARDVPTPTDPIWK